MTDQTQPAQRLKQTIAGLRDVLHRIGSQNTDTTLAPLIADAIARAGLAHQLVAGVAPLEKAALPFIVDQKVFQRLMILAGPETAMELLNQLLLDLRAAQMAMNCAAPLHDWPAVRKNCHVLIAIAGSIGATPVMTSAEAVHRAVQRSDDAAAAAEVGNLLHLLQGLITFVQDEYRAKASA